MTHARFVTQNDVGTTYLHDARRVGDPPRGRRRGPGVVPHPDRGKFVPDLGAPEAGDIQALHLPHVDIAPERVHREADADGEHVPALIRAHAEPADGAAAVEERLVDAAPEGEGALLEVEVSAPRRSP